MKILNLPILEISHLLLFAAFFFSLNIFKFQLLNNLFITIVLKICQSLFHYKITIKLQCNISFSLLHYKLSTFIFSPL